jgi:hypothetical protein
MLNIAWHCEFFVVTLLTSIVSCFALNILSGWAVKKIESLSQITMIEVGEFGYSTHAFF